MPITRRCESSKEISLSRAAKIFSNFVSADNGASGGYDVILGKTFKGFNLLNQLHKELKLSKSHRKNRQSHITDDSVDVKSEKEFRNVDGKSNQIDVKFNQEVNGFEQPKETEKKISNNAKVENGVSVAPRGVEVRSKKRNEAASEVKMQRGKNSEVENAEGQEQQKEVEKKPSTGVNSGGPMGPLDLEIRTNKKIEAVSESKLYAVEKRKKRKSQDGEERIESSLGEHSKKKMKH
ncbi:hypothetical protein MtrunA17_Chr8g0377581 [Medicago truncatula]|uniref:Uncharacterized protein n=1 Tax=Medicago truncatula TaxID=3880 RepID=G7LHA8_MEDTR|nr:uncharacterized protein LOC11438615 [Medicago truncatula]AET04971.1 hypothetical protein MTR_8g097140 [Medicago truncatula]RHN42503.1 hypothetical protein MtrunA17_Chr8g0377581 [Medicago truncatula]